MRRGIWITVLAVVAFAVIVIARLPASWVVPAPPSVVSCGAVDGSIWSGSCAGLNVQGATLGDVVWDIHALKLLTLKLSANIALTRPVGSLHGDFDVGLDKSVTARNVQADIPLDGDVLLLLPPNLQTLRGNINANIDSAYIAKNVIKQIAGHIEVHDLVDHDRQGVATPLGNYAVTFPPAATGDPTGQIKDLGGPLAVDATLRLTQDPGFDLQGYVTPRPDATPALVNQLQYLGSPDAQGRRQFGTSGTF